MFFVLENNWGGHSLWRVWRTVQILFSSLTSKKLCEIMIWKMFINASVSAGKVYQNYVGFEFFVVIFTQSNHLHQCCRTCHELSFSIKTKIFGYWIWDILCSFSKVWHTFKLINHQHQQEDIFRYNICEHSDSTDTELYGMAAKENNEENPRET